MQLITCKFRDAVSIISMLQLLSLVSYLHIVENSLRPLARDFNHRPAKHNIYAAEVLQFMIILAIPRDTLQKVYNILMPEGSVLSSH